MLAVVSFVQILTNMQEYNFQSANKKICNFPKFQQEHRNSYLWINVIFINIYFIDMDRTFSDLKIFRRDLF